MRGRSNGGRGGRPKGPAVLDALSKNLGKIQAFGVKRIGLFGSVLRGKAGPRSDVDVLVEFSEGKATFENLMGLYEYLTGLLGRRVDIVTKEGLSPFIGPHILREVRYVEGAS